MKTKSKIKKQDDNGWKYNSSGFFNLQGYLDFLDEDWRNKDIMLLLNAPRNIGKSWGTWDYIENEIWIKSNFTKRIAYCRTNKERLDKAIENFNARYRGKYYMNKTKIYKQHFDESGKEVLSKRIEIGSVVSLNGEVNYKSGFFENYVMFFYDEYNEQEKLVGVFGKFINLLKTVKRFSTPFLILLVGNKVDAKNDIMTNLKIDLKNNKNKNEDYFACVMDNTYFIDIGIETFAGLHQENDLVNRLAQMNEETDAYLNQGAYLSEDEDNVIIYDYYVKDNNEVVRYFAFDEYKFEYGNFIYEGEVHSYFRQVRTIPKDEFAYTLSIIGDMRVKNSGLLDEETITDFANSLKRKAKSKKLWYCSYDAKLVLEPFIRLNCDWE